MKTLSVARNFSEYPGLRNCDISEDSGEKFYHDVLNTEFFKALQIKEKLTVDLDNTTGYAPSFLDEAFGNLVYDFTLPIVKKFIEIISKQEPHWKNMIEQKTYPQWEQRRKNNESPRVTLSHPAWYRLTNDVISHNVWEMPAGFIDSSVR